MHVTETNTTLNIHTPKLLMHSRTTFDNEVWVLSLPMSHNQSMVCWRLANKKHLAAQGFWREGVADCVYLLFAPIVSKARTGGPVVNAVAIITAHMGSIPGEIPLLLQQ